ncbi:hypothetical protein BD310DRAFT_926958 [Dichomitus squalens]|uniref:Uncharacterized protein n=1 Tax=Dichomitus squalens TaxID=114155 RepID=A0A4Q9PLF0_9APHY|nr:hypothetical protein BD310DRAFT_935925 [Dichomitus squalens]TBU55023.1 hypothetical protein BD310DRAFT_934673 [Dichomitus squalens]TBU56785.1 hypothetical protein BD310DRAFT_930759 [Dichomitus squalens]TBU58447.1 hypothetical protein BD310DRAFT_926958 [Dichomitus squalens]
MIMYMRLHLYYGTSCLDQGTGSPGGQWALKYRHGSTARISILQNIVDLPGYACGQPTGP